MSSARRLAALVARRTTDLLAIAILVVGGLMVGGRLSEWWATEPTPVGPSPDEAAALRNTAGGWGADGAPVVLEFGDFPQALRRQTLKGSRDEIARGLTAWCRETLRRSDPPSADVAASERRLLAQLKSLRPAEMVDGQGRVYRVDVPLLMTMGVRDASSSPPATAGAEAVGDGAAAPADAGRLVCWGFAFALREDVWTLFLSSDRAIERGVAPMPDVPLPEGSRRTLTVRGTNGDGLVGFRGEGDAAAWRESFETWRQSAGWSTVNPWGDEGKRWSVRYSGPHGDAPKSGWRGTVDVLIGREPDGALSGLLSFQPEARPAP